MINIPFAVRQSVFRASFEHGALFHCDNFVFEDFTAGDKFLLVMRGHRTDESCYFYLPTSKVEKYQKNPIFSPWMHIFSKGSIKSFTVDTAVIIDNWHKEHFRRYESRALADSPSLVFLENIDAKQMSPICTLINNSPTIAPAHKRQMIP